VRRAIVFSGGGARGAYEAGVVRFLLRDLPERLGFAPRLDILCGTSVGGLTACWLAATADQGPERADRLEAVWRGMRAEDLLRFSTGGLLGWVSLAVRLLRAAFDRRVPLPFSPSHGLLDRGPFERVVLGAIPLAQIANNRAAGLFDALSVTATDVSTGRAIVFLESTAGFPRHWTPDPTIVARSVTIGRDHALASAAIPIVFPMVVIGGRQYVDGTLRLNTPLVPALRLGADRILVVALCTEGGEVIGERAANHDVEERFALLGKVLSALSLDHVEADLARLRFVNDVLRRGARTFGPDYLERLNETARREGAQPLKLVDEAVIRPSEDPRALANAALERLRARGRVSPLLRLLGASAESAVGEASDLFSYVLFDAEYTGALCDLGYQDARRREGDLVHFFS
jgi:NTE family protein